MAKTFQKYWFDPPRTQTGLDELYADGGTENYWHDLANAEKAEALFAASSISLHAYQGVADSRQADAVLSPHLAAVKVPTLIVVGIADVVCSLTQAERLHLGLPNSKLLVIEDAGHFPWLEQADTFFAGIRQALPFLKK